MAAFSSSTFVSSSTGKQYFYLTAGPADGPLVFFLHGWPGIALTWKYQLQALSGLGFYVVAPDMPGYGQTWTSKDSSEFAMEKLVPQLIELLHHLGHKEAIWFGHDWGCGPLWAIASHHPDVCKAIISMSVPYRCLELGLKTLISLVDRDLYPEDEYPYGQFDYQVFYERDPIAVDRQLESNIPAYVKLLFSKGSAEAGRSHARTSSVTKHKGWFGGPNAPVPDIPLERTTLDEPLFAALTAALSKSGFHGATAWYLNHAANEEYARAKIVGGGVLKMPVLFIHTEYDAVCQTVYNPRVVEGMREFCENLTEFVIKAGHWGMLECPEATNAGVVDWLRREVKDWWPGPELKGPIS